MIGLTGGRPILLATGVTDLRRRVSGLYAIILDQLQAEPLGGTVFAFCNRRRDTVKLFCYDAGGVWVCAKRLQQGAFRWPRVGERSVRLTEADLTLLLSGVDPARTRLRRWWQPAAVASASAAKRVYARADVRTGPPTAR